MSSLGIAAAPLLRRDETITVALLLAFAGGCLDAYTWIIHGTGNMRQAIEGIFAVASGGAAAGTLRRSGIFTAVCCAFGLGAALGALATKAVPDLALGLPVVGLLIVLLRCEVVRSEVRS
ncbi:uncharacterized membrane protein YoaK (UPF0700 family) [Bradyrhizobium sp. USDA 4354]